MSVASLQEVRLYADGASRGNPGPAAVGIVLSDAYDKVLSEHRESIGRATNNEAEYRAVIRGLELASRLTRRRVHVRSDSQLLIRQLTGEYRIQEARLRKLASAVGRRAERFMEVTYEHVPRRHPMVSQADALANQALDERYGRG